MKKSTRNLIKLVSCLIFFCTAASSLSAKESKSDKTKKIDKTENALTQEKPEKTKKAKNTKVKAVDMVPDEGVFQAKTVENTVGAVKYLMKGTVGSFQLYALGDNGSQIPLFAGYDEFTSSFTSLLAGKKEYRLTDNIGIVIGARKSEKGAQLVYIVPDVARVHLKFEQVPHGKEVTSEIIRVTASVCNKGRAAQTFSLKSVLDTVLGEQFGPHFYTNDEIAVNNERQYRNFSRFKWVCSKNSRAGIQFIFSGADIVPPEVVSLSNKDLLALRDWVPVITVSRSFDSVLSYQNSALCINWPSKKVAPEETFSYSYYMAVSVNGNAPDGEKFIEELEKKMKKIDSSKEGKTPSKNFEDGIREASELYVQGKYQEAHGVVLEMWKEPDNRNERLASLRVMIEEKLGMEVEDGVKDVQKGEEPALEQSEKETKTSVQEKITPEQLDTGYIQALVEKINSMNPEDDVDRNEIYKLNAELDAILETLRQQ